MLGGSPIKVAVPPMLAAKISNIKYGYGLTFNFSVIWKVTGTINKTVVTLSKKAEKNAVTIAKTANNPLGLACTFFAPQKATYWNIPDFSQMPTMVIMPISKAKVLKSIPFKAVVCVNIPVKIIIAAANKATTARFNFSENNIK